jgi:hypothetical protein
MTIDTDEETAARELLRAAAEHIHGRVDLFAQVRSRIRRRRRRLTAAGALAAVAVLGTGAAVLHSLPGTPVAASSSAAAPLPACPSTAPADVHSTRPGVADYLVPGSPIEAVACTFSVDKSTGTTPTTPTRVHGLSGTALNDVVAALQQPVSQYAFRCPAHTGPQELYLAFRYSQGPDVAVLISLSCPNLTNGDLTGTFNPEGSLPPALDDLLSTAG